MYLKLQWKLGYIRLNPLDAVTLPRIEKKQIEPMEDEDLARFLKAIKGNPYESVFFVTVFTGLREGEVLGLTWDCVDFEQSTLFINKQHNKIKGGKEYVFSSLKNDKPRLIVAADGVMDALKKQKARQQRWAEQAGRWLFSLLQLLHRNAAKPSPKKPRSIFW